MDAQNVPLDAFATTVKLLYSQVNELTVSVMALRAALMQSSALPIPPEELKRLQEFFREYEPIRMARETMEKLEVRKSEDMLEFLMNFEGPLQ